MASEPTISTAPEETWRRLIRNLLILLAVIGVFAYAAFPIAARFGWLAHPEGRVAVFLAGSIVGEWAAFFLLIWICKREGTRLLDLGWGRPTSVAAFGLALLVAVGYSAITASNPRVGSHLMEWSTLKGLALIAALTAGIVEETIFRGYLVNAVARMKYPVFVQILVSGLAFSLAHVYGLSSLTAYLTTLSLTFLLGVALAVVYWLGKKSLTPVMIAHFLIDAVIEPWLLLSFFSLGK